MYSCRCRSHAQLLARSLPTCGSTDLLCHSPSAGRAALGWWYLLGGSCNEVAWKGIEETTWAPHAPVNASLARGRAPLGAGDRISSHQHIDISLVKRRPVGGDAAVQQVARSCMLQPLCSEAVGVMFPTAQSCSWLEG